MRMNANSMAPPGLVLEHAGLSVVLSIDHAEEP
jgi:hypothetical protein